MITDTELERLERLAEAATPGPWKWWTSNSWRRLKRDDRGITQNVAEPYVSRHDRHPDLEISDEDMAFIAVSREAIPSLISSVRELRARAEAAEAENERLRRALEPFAREAREWGDGVGDDLTPFIGPTQIDVAETTFTVGDLRAARLALENTNG